MFQVAPFSSQAHVIIQITDTHLLEDPQHEFVGINPEQSFHQVIAHIRAHYPKIDAIIHTGDLAQTPTAVTYARYLDYMQTLGIPFFMCQAITTILHIFPSCIVTARYQYCGDGPMASGALEQCCGGESRWLDQRTSVNATAATSSTAPECVHDFGVSSSPI